MWPCISLHGYIAEQFMTPFPKFPFPGCNFQVVQCWPVDHSTVTLQFVFWKWIYSLQITVHIVLFSCLCWFIIVVWLFLIFLCYILPCKWDSVHVYTCGVRQLGKKHTLNGCMYHNYVNLKSSKNVLNLMEFFPKVSRTLQVNIPISFWNFREEEYLRLFFQIRDSEVIGPDEPSISTSEETLGYRH